MSLLTEVRTPQIIATEINIIKEQTRKMILNNSIEIGHRLVEAKSMVSHGEWGSWLKSYVDYSQSTANNLMKIFEEYGANQLSLFGSEAKSQALGNLSYTQAIVLLGLPEEQREEFVKGNDLESMSTRELKQAIKEKQELERKLKESETNAEKERIGAQNMALRYAELERQSQEHEELVSRLNAQITDANQSGDENEERRLQAELTASQNRIRVLEEELKNKPIDVSAIVERIPEGIEIELQELRKKAAQPNSQSAIKFSLCFDVVVRGFQDLLGALNQVKESDPEAHEKYKIAVSGLLGKMSERI